MLDQYGVPERLNVNVSGNLKMLYDDIQFVLKVPIYNFIFRTLALYQNFLSMAWREVRPNMLTCEMEKAAESLRYPPLPFETPQVEWNNYYNKHDLVKIRKIIYTFNYVNTKLLLIASAWYESLSNRPILPKNKKVQLIEPGILPFLEPIHMINYEEASPKIKYLYKDIIDTHHTMDVASDFRALANYPLFLEKSWSFLKEHIGTPEYNNLSSTLLNNALQLAHDMPFPVTINRDLLSYFYSPKDIAGIMGVVNLFLHFLPDLIIDGEFFRRMILNI